MACKARRQGDQMYCYLCLKTWDHDDPEPPVCPEDTNVRHAWTTSNPPNKPNRGKDSG